MSPYAIDASLHATEPERQLLDDGFSAPRAGEGPDLPPAGPPASLEDALASQSEF